MVTEQGDYVSIRLTDFIFGLVCFTTYQTIVSLNTEIQFFFSKQSPVVKYLKKDFNPYNPDHGFIGDRKMV